MDEAIEMPGGFFYGLAHLIVAVEVKDIGNEVEGILVVLDLGVEARQVEAVSQVVLVYLAKVFVASRGDKLWPSPLAEALLTRGVAMEG